MRGGCGHVHKTVAAAQACIERDRQGCARQGAGCYSDRQVRVLVDVYDRHAARKRTLSPIAPGRALTENEEAEGW